MKTYLEQLLRQCVDDVKGEISWKKSENKVMFYKQKKWAQTAKSRWRVANLWPGETLTNQEREKIIEVLMSQERVLTLLYDKTFPPKVGVIVKGNKKNMKK